MPTSLIDADSVLAIDIGTVSTRVILFDVVEGRYRFLGQGSVPTTMGSPINDVSVGVKAALDLLHDITGRVLFGADGQLIVPSQPNGSGIDACVATVSVGASPQSGSDWLVGRCVGRECKKPGIHHLCRAWWRS